MATGELDSKNLDDLFGLQGSGVLITGASSLISVWTARLLQNVGARIVMTDRLDADAIRAAFATLAADRDDPGLKLQDVELVGNVDIRNRSRADAQKLSSSQVRSVEELVEAATAHLGSIDVLINVAGGQEPVPAAMLTTDVLQRTVDRILIGTWNVIHEVFLRSMQQKGGRILTITADVGQGYPMMPAMGAARNALASMHQALAVEWAGFGISACVLAPGATDTPGLERYPEALRVKELGARAANQKRLLHPREVAWLLTTLASPWSRGVNGHAVVQNGGDSFVTPLWRSMMSNHSD